MGGSTQPLLAVLACAALLGTAAGERELKTHQFTKIRECDACLVYSFELAGLCTKTRPASVYASAWAEDLKDRALENAVRNWIWSQPQGHDRGQYKRADDISKMYDKDAAMQHRILSSTKNHAKVKDTKRANLLLGLVSEQEDDLDVLLLRCARGKPASYRDLGKCVCGAICDEQRFLAEGYPDPELVKLIESYSSSETHGVADQPEL